MSLIGFEKKRRHHDEFISPNRGERGPCAICRNYSQLTRSHVLPQAAGNKGKFFANSFLMEISGQADQWLPREFKNGISFRTLCSECNRRLGANEDAAIVEFFTAVRSILSSPVILPPKVFCRTKPNKLVRGILASLLALNDTGARTTFDVDAQQILSTSSDLKNLPYRVYYWPYLGNGFCAIRDIMMTGFKGNDQTMVQMIKLEPVGFAVTDSSTFFNLPCLNMFVAGNDEDECDVPIILGQREDHPYWPAVPGKYGAVFLGASMGVIARREPLHPRHMQRDR